MSKMSIDDIGNVLSTFIEQNVYPKAVGAQKFFTAMASFALADQSRCLAKAYAPAMEMVGLVSAGHIDLEKLHEYASKAISKVGKFEYAGIIFGADDVEAIISIAERYAQ